MSGDEKVKLEESIVEEAKTFVESLVEREGNRVSSAVAVTNTTGSVNLMDQAS